MTPLALELEGFTVYRQHTVVEWGGADTSLFAVTGPTGAGKSTLLDAITYVLYGKTARLGSKGLSGLISPGAESLFARLTFRTARGVFRATRVAQRKGGGVGTEVRIEEAVEGAQPGSQDGWRQLAESERVKDANYALEQIVGLDYDGFTRAVLLPQGAFDEFLRGDASLRRQLLSSLLGLDKVERVQRLASTRAAELKGQLEACRALLDNEYGEVGTESVTELEAAVKQLSETVSEGEKRLEQLSADLTTLRGVAAIYSELSQIHIGRHRLAAETERVSEARRVAERARLAASVAPYLQQLHQARSRAEVAAKTVAERKAEVQAAGQRLADQRASGSALRSAAAADVERLERVAKAFKDAVPLHDTLVRRGGALSLAQECSAPMHDAEHALVEDDQWLAWQKALSLIKPFERALQEEHAALHAAEIGHAQRAAKQREVEDGAAALELKVTEGKRLRQLDEEAQARLTQARRSDLAAAIRQGLAAGDQCPVCGGSVGEHSPADHGSDLQAAIERAELTAEALAEARAEYDAARIAQSRADADLANLTQRLADAVAAVHKARQQVELAAKDLRACGAEPDSLTADADSPDAFSPVTPEIGGHASFDIGAGSRLRARLTERLTASLVAHAAALAHRLSGFGVSESSFPGLAQARTLAPFLTVTDKQLDALSQSLQQLDGAEADLAKAVDTATARLENAVESEQKYVADLEQTVAQTGQAVAAAGFTEIEEVTACTLVPAELSRLEALVSAHEAEARRLDHRQVELMAELAVRPHAQLAADGGTSTLDDPEMLAGAAAERVAEAEDVVRVRTEAAAADRQRLGGLIGQLEAAKERLKRSVQLRRQITELEAEHGLYHQLNTDLHGNRFPEHLLTQVQQLLARRASAILQMVTDGRYDLRLESGDYLVADAWADGELRSARTLSGGESFVASLALALALSDTLAGSAALGALFLDEGFGTLDRATLDAVTNVLEGLTSEGRMVGVITHVPELSARLPARLVVTKGPGGSSVAWDA